MSRRLSSSGRWPSVMQLFLQRALQAMEQWKDSPDSPKRLHEMRIACRQAEAALRLCRDLLPHQSVDWLRKRLRKIRRTTNAVRDQDVWQKWLKTHETGISVDTRKPLKPLCHDAQMQLISGHRASEHFKRHLDHIQQAITESSFTQSNACLGRRLLKEVFRFLDLLPTVHSEVRSLHQLRVACKRLRYACEVMAEIIPTVNLQPLILRLKQIQVRLGQLHDAQIRSTLLKKIHPPQSASLQPALGTELKQLSQDWSLWWSTNRLDKVVGSAVSQILLVICTTP